MLSADTTLDTFVIHAKTSQTKASNSTHTEVTLLIGVQIIRLRARRSDSTATDVSGGGEGGGGEGGGGFCAHQHFD